MDDDKKALSLGEQFFLAARDLPGVEARYRQNIAQGQAGTRSDVEQRLAGIAPTLKARLQDFIAEVANGRTRIASFGEAHRHDEEPLRFQLAFPAGLESQEAFDFLDQLTRSKAYQDIVAVTSGPDVDMAIRSSMLSESLVGGGQPPRTVYSLVIEINPGRPAQKKKPAPSGAATP